MEVTKVEWAEHGGGIAAGVGRSMGPTGRGGVGKRRAGSARPLGGFAFAAAICVASVALLSVGGRCSFGCDPYPYTWWEPGGAPTATGTCCGYGPGQQIVRLYDPSLQYLSCYDLSVDGDVTDSDDHYTWDRAQNQGVCDYSADDKSWGPATLVDQPVNGPGHYIATVCFQDDDDPPGGCDEGGCYADTADVWIFWPTVTFNVPGRVVPRNGSPANVSVSPDPLPDGYSISLGSLAAYGTVGSVSVYPSSVAHSQDVTLVGGDESWSSWEEFGPAPNNVSVVATIENRNLGLSSPFTVCAHLMNFQETDREVRGSGLDTELHFEYGWESDSGQIGDLNKVYLGEYVTYPGPFPNPPYIPYGPGRMWQPPNPSIGGGVGWAAYTGMTDDQIIMGLIDTTGVSPTQSPFAVTAHQQYRWSCVRCMSQGSGPSSANYGIDCGMGDIPIERSVEFIPATPPTIPYWRYRITKSGLTATVP